MAVTVKWGHHFSGLWKRDRDHVGNECSIAMDGIVFIVLLIYQK